MEKTKIICVVGATASGKTDLAVKLAKAVDGEIISADSMQVYKNMPIATAVATKEEQDGVPHHLVEFLDTDQTFSVADFVERAKVLIDEITARGRVPIVAGGTGLFVDSLVKNISFSQVGSNAEIRNELAEKSNEELFEKLLELDPKSAEDIHPNNRKRVIRALELCMSGTSKTEQNENSMLIDSPYDALYIGIGYRDRQKLYDRINKRVDLMLEAGLENEARQMLDKQGLTARQAIGHKELQPYIDGNITLDEAVEGLKRETRRYAKRQLTWFRRNENINWLYADEMSRDELVEKAVDLAKNHLK
ncbi:tRNA (adenosine(37)-N6)-dimethylallyltransferase MiaA [Eubacterium coprostanoligenes]|uniref:tRNA dimethylallyltransferase n=1 Tax=Eubacterium coprostanoligenes TaxID=290054 RepID=A0A1T4K2X4_9FIRM|nr:tRNA (adenosine(37)-N6)-dimethylallyltransferase MiaA [Eubacterium coprostanoligenes]SJZ36627.1 tRNA dimethylallyltransferase [Eubacterium coprostanoligenes]